MSSRKQRRSLGGGISAEMPAPRRAPDTQQLADVAAELRELLAEARGVLGDLVRERKAVEKLARTRAEEIIEAHVNRCMDDLNAHITKTIQITDRETRTFFQKMIGNATRMTGPGPSLPEALEAATTLRRAMMAQVLHDAEEGGSGG